MKDYSNLSVVELMLNLILQQKHILEYKQAKEQAIFNRTLGITLEGMKLDIDEMQDQQVRLYPERDEFITHH